MLAGLEDSRCRASARVSSLPVAAVVLLSGLAPDARASDAPRIVVTYNSDKSDSFLYGRLLLLFSTDDERRAALPDQRHGPEHQQVFGIDVDGWAPGRRRPSTPACSATRWRAWPRPARRLPGAGAAPPLRDLPPRRRPRGEAADGPRRGAAVEPAPGQPVLDAAEGAFDPARRAGPNRPRPGDPADPERRHTKYIRHERIQSERLTKFWGRPMYLGAPSCCRRASTRTPTRAIRWSSTTATSRDTISGSARRRPIPNLQARLLRPLPPRRATTACSRSTPTASTRTGRRPASRAAHDQDPARQPLLRRLLRRELRRTSAPTATPSPTS